MEALSDSMKGEKTLLYVELLLCIRQPGSRVMK